MSEWLLSHEPQVRLTAFLGLLCLLMGLEFIWPWRRAAIPRLYRWSNNLALIAVNTIVLRLVFPAAAVGFAYWAERKNIGLFHWLELPVLVELLLSIVLLDLAIYGQHVAFHKVPIFWRLHRMHHADLELDVTSGTRFHPAEILASMGIKFLVVVGLGAGPIAVLIFEILLNATSMFSHSNIRLPTSMERVLRKIIVTPSMHRVHHSVLRNEHDSNYGFNLSIWDRIFGSYREQAIAGSDNLKIGLDQFQNPRELRLDRMLVQPLRRP